MAKTNNDQINTCPFLGLNDDNTSHMAFTSPENHCYHCKPIAPIKLEHQNDYCLDPNFLTCPIFTHKLSRGPKKYMGVGIVDQIHRRIDVEVVQPHEYPFALMYFTGPKTFNTKLRDHFKEMGYTLNEKSLNDDEGTLYPANSEEDIFEMAGLQYLTPEERDKY